jgi:Cu-processing system permease protein
VLQFFLSSWRAGFRDRTFLAVFALGVALVALAYLSASFSPRQPLTVALDVGLSGFRFSLVLFAIILTQDLVGREIEKRSVVLTLSYPVHRATYLIGRYLGVLALTGVAALLLGLLLWTAVITLGVHYDQEFRVSLGVPYWATVFGVWVDVAVVAAFSLWIATLSTVPMLALVLGALFAIAGRAVGAVFDFLEKGAEGQTELVVRFGPALDTIRWVLPDLSRLDWRVWPMYGLLPDMQAIMLSLLMALAYCLAMIGFSVHAFSKREFS